jgi:hypothetical protein
VNICQALVTREGTINKAAALLVGMISASRPMADGWQAQADDAFDEAREKEHRGDEAEIVQLSLRA